MARGWQSAWVRWRISREYFCTSERCTVLLLSSNFGVQSALPSAFLRHGRQNTAIEQIGKNYIYPLGYWHIRQSRDLRPCRGWLAHLHVASHAQGTPLRSQR